MRNTILLLISLLAIDSISAQTLCNNRNSVFISVEHPPKPNLTDKELEAKLNELINPSLMESYKANYLYITFVVNCKGEDFNYKLAKMQDGKIQKDSLSNFQEVFLSKMQFLLSCTPGTMDVKENGKMIEKAVDCQRLYIFRNDGNKLHILNEKETQKLFKRSLK